MRYVKATFLAALGVITTSAFATPTGAAPLLTNIRAMKAALDTPVTQVRYGGWRGGGYRGWGGGYRGWGGRGWGYRGYGLGAAAVVGGAVASSAYYGGSPYYGGDYGSYYGGDYGSYYGAGYDSCSCPQYGYGGYAPGYYARQYGW
jgi:hypothetical protein